MLGAYYKKSESFSSLSHFPLSNHKERKRAGREPNPPPNDPSDCALCLGFLGNMLHEVRPELAAPAPPSTVC